VFIFNGVKNAQKLASVFVYYEKNQLQFVFIMARVCFLFSFCIFVHENG